ncbi:MAG: sigma 54-interacting transcriptional regulator [Syntrophomonadaceae bacterium]|jgi:PAS domain S-box-containing protein/TyrR family helix-turn-helix protein|nr:sigma 54-interacting transcriptional regulator [Syntrophomonadaceae bacterium]
MKKQKDFVQKIFNALPHALMLINGEGRIDFFNEEMARLLKLPPNAAGRELQGVDPHNSILKMIANSRREEKKNIKISDKKYYYRLYLLENEDYTGKLILLMEQTALESLNVELAETRGRKEEMDKILESSFDYIFLTDAQGNVERINEAYTRITGYEPDEILGENIYELVKRGYFDRAATIDVIETKETITLTQTLKSGKTVLVTGNPIFAETGELTGVVTNGRDITELNRLKNEIKKAESLSQHYQNELLKIQMDKTGDYIVASPKMIEIADLVNRIARVDSTVLINGESGVGKEIVAREIHRNSLRDDKPYISVNCAAIPDNLLESELFGYEPGAFTGASKSGKMGIFQLADGGTLLLDEIAELPFYLQAKLLRAIQENEIMRIGASAPIAIDVRLITATNRDLWKMVKDRQFREDLYYRLNVIQIRIPPLRERKEEIPVFIDYFIGMLNKKYNLNRQFNPDLIKGMLEYEWPGNIRELRNVLEQAFVTTPGALISEIKMGPAQEIHLNADPITPPGQATPGEGKIIGNTGESGKFTLKDAMQQFEAEIIKQTLAEHVTTRKAAAALGVSQATIWRKAKQYDISIEENRD